MIGVNGSVSMGTITGVASDFCHSPETWGRMQRNKIIQVSNTAPPAVKDQAIEFANRIERVCTNYARMIEEESRSKIIMALRDMGEDRAAEIVRKL